MKRLLLIWIALAFGTTGATTILQSVTLPELVRESDRAIVAEVLRVEYGYDENRLPSTRVTLRVEETLFGKVSDETLEIKLFGAPTKMDDGLRLFVDGTPRYQRGDRYLLLLIPTSKWGFTNTAGLGFGAFKVSADGREIEHTYRPEREAYLPFRERLIRLKETAAAAP